MGEPTFPLPFCSPSLEEVGEEGASISLCRLSSPALVLIASCSPHCKGGISLEIVGDAGDWTNEMISSWSQVLSARERGLCPTCRAPRVVLGSRGNQQAEQTSEWPEVRGPLYLRGMLVACWNNFVN